MPILTAFKAELAKYQQGTKLDRSLHDRRLTAAKLSLINNFLAATQDIEYTDNTIQELLATKKLILNFQLQNIILENKFNEMHSTTAQNLSLGMNPVSAWGISSITQSRLQRLSEKYLDKIATGLTERHADPALSADLDFKQALINLTQNIEQNMAYYLGINSKVDALSLEKKTLVRVARLHLQLFNEGFINDEFTKAEAMAKVCNTLKALQGDNSKLEAKLQKTYYSFGTSPVKIGFFESARQHFSASRIYRLTDNALQRQLILNDTYQIEFSSLLISNPSLFIRAPQSQIMQP
jgi:hypothetical protein